MRTVDKTRVITIFVLAALLVATTAYWKFRVSHGVQTAEYEVLSAFIDAKSANQKSSVPPNPASDRISLFVIQKLTESDEQIDSFMVGGNGQPIPWTQTTASLQSKEPTLKRTTADAFREANSRQTTFQHSFHTVTDYEIVDSAELDPILKNGSWPAFYKRFPNSPGLVQFSRVGFGTDGTQALFYVSHACGGLCGGGEYVVMERHDGRWVIEKEIEMWMS